MGSGNIVFRGFGELLHASLGARMHQQGKDVRPNRERYPELMQGRFLQLASANTAAIRDQAGKKLG
jgi:hypothetical protein